MTDAHDLNSLTKLGRTRAEAHMPELEAAYASLLEAGGRAAAENFRQQVTTSGMVAAVDPWEPPTGDLVGADELEQDAAKKIAPIHQRVLAAVSPAADLGIAFDVKHATSQALLTGIGKRLGSVSDAIRQQVNETVVEGHAAGWSVAQTAKAIIAKVNSVTPGRASMLARSDLNALSNGASLATALQVGVTSKTWLATNDDRTRETHADADGQTVPINQPFDVGGESAMYPGDPDLSDEEAANCRCTLEYSADSVAAATPEGGEMNDETLVAATDGETLSIETLQALTTEQLETQQESLTRVLTLRKLATLGEFTIVAAAGPGEPTRWVAPAIAVEMQPTEDGRVLMLDSTTWRPGVLPLGVMMNTPHGDLSEAPLCGGIDTFERIGPVISAGGYFNDNLDPDAAPDLVAAAMQAIEGINSGTLTGISVDLMVMDGGIIEESALNPDGQDELPPEVGEDLALELPYPEASDIDEESIVIPQGRLLNAVYQGVIGGACIVPVPAISNASIAVVAAGSFERFVITTALKPDCGCDETLIAAALQSTGEFTVTPPLVPPLEWFEDPKLDKPTPLTITDDGRVFGHVATEGVCHEGFRGRCVLAPRSRMGYAKFMNGETIVEGGERINVGKITLKAGHAGTQGISEAQARAHYDNTATIAAFVRAGDDRHGIWVAGSLKTQLAPELIRDLMASPLSGDWRNGEMVAAHAVIDPGFPVLRASGLGELFEDNEIEEPIDEPRSPLEYLKVAI